MPYDFTYVRWCAECGLEKTGWYRNNKTGRITGSLCRDCYLQSRREAKDKPTDPNRDAQRKRVYESEWALSGSSYRPIRVPDLETAQEMIDCITQTGWYREQFPDGFKRVTVKINHQSKGRWAFGNWGTITLPPRAKGLWAWTDVVLVHELAHNAQQARPAHGPEFASAMLRLTERYIPEMYDGLLQQYEHRRVRVAGMTFDRRSV